MERFAARASLAGIKELYLIILALGVTDALVNIPMAECSFTYFSYIFLLIGFLSTVFRFVLEMMILLEHVSLKHCEYWTKTVFFISVLCLLSSITVYLMGHNLGHFDQFIIYTIVLLTVDLMLLIVSHKPWNKGGVGYFFKKGLSILSWHKLFPAFNPDREGIEDEEKRKVKRTHYQWGRSNVYLGLFLFLIVHQWYLDMTLESCPLTSPSSPTEFAYWIFFLPQRLWLFQWIAATILFLFAMWDLTVNYSYYFGNKAEN